MQVNVGRSSSAHNIALAYAQENQIDVVLIQEPWIYSDLSIRRTKSHHDFETFSPVSTWLSRPRVITHIRRDLHLKQYQVTSDFSRDIVQIVISRGDNKKIPIWNVYNTPTDSNGAGEGLSTLLGCTDTPCFVGEDFNLRHPSWDSSTTFTLSSCSNLIEWYEN